MKVMADSKRQELHDPSEDLDIGRQPIEKEAILLEEQRWDEWVDLYTEDCIYWVRAWRHDDTLSEDPQLELSLIYYNDRAGLEDRVIRIKSPNSPAGRRMTRLTHLDGNIRIEDGDGTDGYISSALG
jgi:3-phenylpropionate/cinnamic acid dioxygenase small subunit